MKKAVIVATAAIAIVAVAGGYLLQQKLTQRSQPAAADAGTRKASGAQDALPEVPESSAPDQRIAFTLPDLEGNPHALDEWKGKARLVNFWATWCAPCRREIPLLKQTQAEHAEKNLQIIGVAVDFHEDVVAYAESADFNYPILIGQDDAMAAAETSGVPFIGLPFTMVITPDGKLLKAHMGEIVASQIATIVDVFERLREGEITLAQAREELDKF